MAKQNCEMILKAGFTDPNLKDRGKKFFCSFQKLCLTRVESSHFADCFSTDYHGAVAGCQSHVDRVELLFYFNVAHQGAFYFAAA